MGAAVVPILIVVGVLVVGALLARQFAQREMSRGHHAGPGVGDGTADSLRYPVPEGQDPVAVVAALAQHGFEALTDQTSGAQDVVVTCPNGVARDRETVREAIAAAPLDLDHDQGPSGDHRVRFADE